MISSGITLIDEMLGGGIPKKSRVLFSMEPGAMGQLFIVSAFLSAVRQQIPSLVILPNTTVEAFLHDAALVHGGPVDLSFGTIVFMDSVDRERIQRNARTPAAREREWQARIRKVCSEKRVEIIFAYFDLLYEDCGLKKGLELLRTAVDGETPTIILEHLNLEGKTLVDRFISEFAFDLVVTIHSSFPPAPQFNFFSLAHASWPKVPKRSVPFVVSEGKIVPYIPRLVITGPAGSGKSTFVTSASDEGYSIDRQGTNGDATTVAMDFGSLCWRGFHINLCGTPGHSRFDPLIPSLVHHAMGVVVLVDATRPETFSRARDLTGLMSKYRMPVIIAANKYDLPGAAGEQEIRRSLGASNDTPVFFISALKKADCHRVLETMVDQVTQFSY